jgi:hypothetical protein
VIGGLIIIEDANLVDTTEDWSGCRSRARAERRRKRGFPQRVKIVGTPKKEAYRVGDKLYMHPAMAAALRAHPAVDVPMPSERPSIFERFRF